MIRLSSGAWRWTTWVLLLAPCSLLPAEPNARRDIVFLLGRDSLAKGYFSAAGDYYRQTMPQAEIVPAVSSLAAVRELLARHRGSQPWGRIVLVAHGTQWSGLLVPVFEDGELAQLQALVRVAENGEFPPLDDAVIDAGSELLIESCGLGRRPDYLRAMATLFGGLDRRRPQTRSSRGLVWFYSRAAVGGAEAQAERRELHYVGGLQPGSVEVSTRAALADQPRLIRKYYASSPLPAPVAPIQVRLPVHVTVLADDRELARYPTPTDYLRRSPDLRRNFGPKALDAGRLHWRLRPAGAATQLVGEGMIVIEMQPAPVPGSNPEQVLRLQQ